MIAARLKLEAARTYLAITSAALNQLEAKVGSMGPSPRYIVAWEQSLRNARKADDDAQAALANAKLDLDRIIEAIARETR